MKHAIPALLCASLLSGCLSALAGKGEPVGMRNGKPLYQTRCTVDLSTAGKKGLFCSGTVPLHGSCDAAAQNRCGANNATIVKIDRSNRRRITDTIQNGPYVQRRTYPAENLSMVFTCKA
jgi:hypothetical protein